MTENEKQWVPKKSIKDLILSAFEQGVSYGYHGEQAEQVYPGDRQFWQDVADLFPPEITLEALRPPEEKGVEKGAEKGA